MVKSGMADKWSFLVTLFVESIVTAWDVEGIIFCLQCFDTRQKSLKPT